MSRFRLKAIGLGLALTAGVGLAADGEWAAPGVAAPRAPAARDEAPIWLPARPAPPAPIAQAGARTEPTPAGPQPAPRPPTVPPQTKWSPEPPAVGPRGGDIGLLAAVPDLPGLPALPPMTPEPPTARYPKAPAGGAAQPPARQPDPVTPPRTGEPPARPVQQPKMPPPAFVPESKGEPPPAPRPFVLVPGPAADPQPELPPAPAELMYPSGAFGAPRHGKGTFGSPPIRLSQDYPPLHEFTGHGERGPGALDDGPGLMNRSFVRAEYLMWWLPGFAAPVLATTNPDPALNGYLGQPGTTAILGPGSITDSTRGGLRVRAGTWLNDEHSCGADGSFFFLGNGGRTAAFGPDQFPVITRPIFAPNLIPGTNAPLGESGEAVAVPGILRGTLAVQADSRLWGADVNARWCWKKGCDSRSEVFAGYRHLDLRESLTFTEDITVIGPGGNRLALADPVGTRIGVRDSFAARNQFNGGQVGALYERRSGRWDMGARGSVALGTTHQTLEIDGGQTRLFPGATAPMTFRGGLLAAGPNLGRFERNQFSVAPEFTLNVGYAVTSSVRVYAGYNFLFWSGVIRPGDQIDHVVDLTFVPNALPANFSGQYRPRPPFKQADLAVNGMQFGLDLRW